MKRGWLDVELESLDLPDWSFRRRDETALLKLAESLAHHGQVQALVTYEAAAGRHVVLDGRLVLEAMRRLGTFTHAHVRSLRPLTRLEAMRVALSLENRSDTDYVRLAAVVGELAATYADVPEACAMLARTTPFSPDQLRHYVTLLTFDWKQFAEEPDEQHGFDWEVQSEEDAPLRPSAAQPPGAQELIDAAAEASEMFGDDVLEESAARLASWAAETLSALPVFDGHVPEPDVELPLLVQPGLFGAEDE